MKKLNKQLTVFGTEVKKLMSDPDHSNEDYILDMLCDELDEAGIESPMFEPVSDDQLLEIVNSIKQAASNGTDLEVGTAVYNILCSID